MEKNYNAELDFILEQLIYEYENVYKGVSFYADESFTTTKEKITILVVDKFKLKEWEINLLFYTLLLDKYLKSIDPLTISLEGLVFRNNGGYAKKMEMQNRESNRLESIQKDFKMRYLLMTKTLFLAAAIMPICIFRAIPKRQLNKNFCKKL